LNLNTEEKTGPFREKDYNKSIDDFKLSIVRIGKNMSDFNVLIIGSGPAGLFTAIWLERLGVDKNCDLRQEAIFGRWLAE